MTPLVLVHGFMGGGKQWDLQSPLAEDRALICLDLPGFGDSAHVSPLDRIEDFADWVLDQLTDRGVGQFDLLGHSMGGMIVQDMVRLAPDRVRRLVLYATGAIGVLPGRFETIEVSQSRAKEDGPAATARRIAATWFRAYEAADGYHTCAEIAERSSLPAILAGLDAMQAWSGEEHLATISNQTLIVWGDHDRTYPWSQTELLWRAVADSRLFVAPNCAHAVHMEYPSVFNQVVGDFLSAA